jgi:hypothetical protein
MAFTITPQAPYAWQKGDKHACHQALGIWPFQSSPFDVDSDEPPAWVMKREADAFMGATSWARAWELRQALCELAGEHGRMIDMDGRWRRSAARGQALSNGRHSTGDSPAAHQSARAELGGPAAAGGRDSEGRRRPGL